MFNKIIFVAYINRSGSTFLVNNLSKSRDILVCPEAEILIDLFLNTPDKHFYPDKSFLNKLYKAIGTDHKLKYWGLKKEDIIHDITHERTCFDAFIKFINVYRKKVKPKANILVFKAERLIFFYNKIHPFSVKFNIKFIAVIRDCRAIFYSQNNTLIPETDHIMENNSFRMAKRWNTFMRLAIKFAKNNDFFTVSYESLIKDFNYYFKFVCDKLDVKPINTDNKGDLKYRMPASQLVMHKNMEKVPEIDKINSWYNGINSSHLYILELVSAKLLLERGYKLVNIKKNSFKIFKLLIFEYLSFLFLSINKIIKYRFGN